MMRVRSYFLFPDLAHIRAVVEQLRRANVGEDDMHVVAEQVVGGQPIDDSGLPIATDEQRTDQLHRLERGLWGGNLVLFFVAVAVMVFSLWIGWGAIATLSGVVAAISLITGLLWAFVPDVSLNEFSSALRHGELLLMVDMERINQRKIESLVRHNHPEVVLGGSTFYPA